MKDTFKRNHDQDGNDSDDDDEPNAKKQRLTTLLEETIIAVEDVDWKPVRWNDGTDKGVWGGMGLPTDEAAAETP